MSLDTAITIAGFLLTILVNSSVVSYCMGIISAKVAVYGEQIKNLSSGMIAAGTEIGDHEARIRVIESKLSKPH